ncbi:MAG: REP-associated tyrosine transposase [Gaiellaceae bacterium]|nr:REP-associated tyrosine transposase [Gaiellaceae bacterium]
MARKLRFEEPNGIYHVGSRGNNGEAVFRDDVDRMEWLRLLAKVAVKYRWLGWTYVLMGNHFHFVVQIPHGGLSRGMQVLNTGYSVRANKRYGRTGHLVRNRFYSNLLEDDAHLTEAIRYIVLNPVRAGLCGSPEDWPWSSYRACAGAELAHPFLSVDLVLGLFGTRPATARAAFCSFVRAGHVPVSDTSLGM